MPITAIIVTVGPRNVAYDRAQTLTSAQQAQAKANLSLENVDNTADANKPVSTATQAAINLRVKKSSHAIITVANAAERKTLSTYDPNGPVVGVTRVKQDDLDNIVWLLISADVTQDASWYGLPYTTDAGGELPLSVVLPDVSNTVPDNGVLGQRDGYVVKGDGVTVGGKIINGTPTILHTSTAGIVEQLNGDIPVSWKESDATAKVLVIGTSCTVVGSSAFEQSGCTGTLFIPPSVITIGEEAFKDCFGHVGDLAIPNSVTSVGQFAFSYCEFDGTLTLGNSIETIGANAFANMPNIGGSPVVPDSTTSIGQGAFSESSGLAGLELGSGLVDAGSVGGNLLFGSTGVTTLTVHCNASVFDANALNGSSVTSIVVDDAAAQGFTLGAGQTLFGKTGITVSEAA